MTEGWVVLITFVIGMGIAGLCIWADRKDQAAHDAWYEHPDRIWNQWRSQAR